MSPCVVVVVVVDVVPVDDRVRMCASMATGLVGMEENYFVADFFDRLGFFPLAEER